MTNDEAAALRAEREENEGAIRVWRRRCTEAEGRLQNALSERDALLAEREALKAELSAHKAAHDIGQPQAGYREMVWREAQAFYENESEALRSIAAEREALRAALEYAVPVLEEAQEALLECDDVCMTEDGDDAFAVAILKARAALSGSAAP